MDKQRVCAEPGPGGSSDLEAPGVLPPAAEKSRHEPGEKNAEAERQARGRALRQLREDPTEESLWDCVVAFQRYPFYTASGLPFTYTLKSGRRGAYTKELFIDRRENSKSLAWSSVRMAFEKALEKGGAVFDRPKAIADIRGISYSYSLLWRFGVIAVPESVERRLRGDEDIWT